MSFNPKELFDVIECSYRHGVLDKMLSIQGEAMQAAIDEGGLNMGDLVNKMDEASDESILKVDKMLGRIGPVLKYMHSDRLMEFVSRILDVPFIRRKLVENMKRSTLKSVAGEAPPSPMKRAMATTGKNASVG